MSNIKAVLLWIPWYRKCFSYTINVYHMWLTHLQQSLDRPPTLDLNIAMLGTVTPAPADVGVNPDHNG